MTGFVSPATLALAALAATATVAAWLLVVAALHRRALGAVPIRVHVVGTRGKSTVTRLIAAGLRAEGRQILARTTGTTPTLLLPDGSERPWRRTGPASIREYERLLRLAKWHQVDALVVECMAIRPELVWATEHLLLRATHTVVTNARADHEEELGPEPDAMARSLTLAVPTCGTVVMAEEAAQPTFLARAQALQSDVHVVVTDPLDPNGANRQLAWAACERLGAGERARTAIASAAMADGLRPTPVTIGGKTVRFADAFACNDATSLRSLWERHATDGPTPVVVLLNARADRPLRSQAMLRFLAECRRPIHLFLAGDGLGWLAHRARAESFAAVVPLRWADPATVLRRLVEAAEPGAVVWGIGNHRGLGRRLGELVGPAPC